jgi:hypothetical protein
MGQGSPGSEHQVAVRDLRDLVVDRPHGLETKPPGTEFLDAETGS